MDNLADQSLVDIMLATAAGVSIRSQATTIRTAAGNLRAGQADGVPVTARQYPAAPLPDRTDKPARTLRVADELARRRFGRFKPACPTSYLALSTQVGD